MRLRQLPPGHVLPYSAMAIGGSSPVGRCIRAASPHSARPTGHDALLGGEEPARRAVGSGQRGADHALGGVLRAHRRKLAVAGREVGPHPPRADGVLQQRRSVEM